MKTHKFYKAFIIFGAVLFSLIFFSSNAFPWASGIHAYVDDNIGRDFKLCNLNEIYGSMAADTFNLSPDVLDPNSPYYFLYIKAHFHSLQLWAVARAAACTNLGKASAFGFVSHDNWQMGADFLAHGHNKDGYVDPKASQIYNDPVDPRLRNAFGLLGLSEEYALEILHILVEYALDIKVAYDLAPTAKIGKKMIASAMVRSPEFPYLFVKAYARDLAREFPGISRFRAARTIISAEREFRKTIMIYGQTLTLPSKIESIDSVAILLASLAQEIYGITPGGPFTEEDIINLIKYALNNAMLICTDFDADYLQGIVDYVGTEMYKAGILY